MVNRSRGRLHKCLKPGAMICSPLGWLDLLGSSYRDGELLASEVKEPHPDTDLSFLPEKGAGLDRREKRKRAK